MQKSRSFPHSLITWILVLSLSGVLPLCSPIKALAQNPQEWYQRGQRAVQEAKGLQALSQPAKNVILFIGDGMNLPTVTAARIFEGQIRGLKGEENILSFEKLPYVALSKTYCTNATVTDSAAAMTAIVTGVKTKDGVLSTGPMVTPHKASTVSGNELITMFEIAEQKGLSTGVVTTTRVTHATPAACYAHSPDRDWECDSDIKIADDPANSAFPDIARQLIEFPFGNGLEVALGGGRSWFTPNTAADPEYSGTFGKRKDGRDLTQEWLTKHPASSYVWNKSQFEAINPHTTSHLLGLFEPSHMKYEADRKKTGDEPSLSEMTGKAIDILSKNRKGFMLMVEGGRIDHAHHDNNGYRLLTDTVEFAKAVDVALKKTDLKDTLIVVTADHGHVLAIAGYPTRGNPILGKVVGNDYWGNPSNDYSKAADGLPYTTLVYGNGPGYTSPRQDLTGVDTTAPDYKQQAAVPMAGGSETHSGEDVAIYAGGPGAYLFHGVQEESYIFHAITEAMKLK